MIESYVVITTDDRDVAAKAQHLLTSGRASLDMFVQEMIGRFKYPPFAIVAANDYRAVESYLAAGMEFYEITKGMVRKSSIN